MEDRVHLLLMPHVAEMDPIQKLNKIKTGWLPHQPSYWGNFGITTSETGLIHFAVVGEFSSGHHFEEKAGRLCLNNSLRGISKKHEDFLIGRGLDLILDIPLAHKFPITQITRELIYFDSPYIGWDETVIPRHTSESFTWRKRRRGLEIFMNLPLNQFNYDVLRQISFEDMRTVEFGSVNDPKSSLYIPGDMAGFSKGSSVSIGTTRNETFIVMDGNTIVNNKITIQGEYPESYVASLPGKRASVIIDNEAFKNAEITSARRDGKTLIISLDRDPYIPLGLVKDLFPDLDMIVGEARENEKKHLPEIMKEWDAFLESTDDERTVDPAEKVLSTHLYKTLDGGIRPEWKTIKK